MFSTISEQLASIGVPYEFMRWTGAVTYPYFVGECSEIPNTAEDGGEEYSFILTGFTRGSWLELEQMKNKIRSHFPTADGFRAVTADGAIVISYEQGFPVPTGEADLKKIQINLNIKAWKGM